MLFKKTLLLSAALVLPLATADQASAQYGVGGCGYGYGCYADIGRLYQVLADNVPHYAAFPPVYYSQPVPRTYGYSPFAYPPGYATPAVEAPQPKSIDNPYYEAQPEEEGESVGPALDATTAAPQQLAPLVIDNPYVAPGRTHLQTAFAQ